MRKGSLGSIWWSSQKRSCESASSRVLLGGSSPIWPNPEILLSLALTALGSGSPLTSDEDRVRSPLRPDRRSPIGLGRAPLGDR